MPISHDTLCLCSWSQTGEILSAQPFCSDLHLTLISVKPVICSAALLPAQERQLQSHAKMLESFKADLSYLQQNPPEGKKAKAKELEEQRVRAEYLQHEVIKAV